MSGDRYPDSGKTYINPKETVRSDREYHAPYNTPAGCGAIGKGSVNTIVNAIAETVADMHKQLDSLQKRLADVSLPSPENIGKDGPEDPAPPMSDLARSLRSINGNLTFLAERITAIEARVDL